MKSVIRPLEFVNAAKGILYLAGPIKGAPDWHGEAAACIHNLDPHVKIVSPRRKTETAGKLSDEEYDLQIRWQLHYFEEACRRGVVLVWLAKEAAHDCGRAYAQTARLQIGQLMEKHSRGNARMVVGIEEGFTGARNILRNLARLCPDVAVQSRLSETCRIAVDMLTCRYEHPPLTAKD